MVTAASSLRFEATHLQNTSSIIKFCDVNGTKNSSDTKKALELIITQFYLSKKLRMRLRN